MRKSAIGLLTLTIYATAFVVVPAVPLAKAETSISDKKKIRESRNISDRNISDRKPASSTWPPPMDEDPDRKAAGGGGGGM